MISRRLAPVALTVMLATPTAHAVQVNIPPGPLGQALSNFASHAGVMLSFPSEMTAGMHSPGLRGDVSVQAGFAALLAGSGLEAISPAEGRYTLRKRVAAQPAPPAVSSTAPSSGTLATVTVNASTDTGPVQGYLAKRSVSATKTDATVLETPQSISVVTRAQIEDQAATSVREALRYTPGLVAEYRGAGGTRYDTVIYRGFGGGINYDYAYLDGMRQLGSNYAIPQVDPYQLERVDVLRGPASVLYGQGTPGGLINLVSKQPTPDRLREVQVQVGNNSWKQLGVDLGGALNADGTLSYRLTGVGHDGNSQVKQQQDQRAALSGGLSWEPDTDTQLTLLARFQHDPKGGYYGFLPAVGTVKPLPDGSRIPRNFFDGSPNYDQFSRTQSSIGYQFDKRIGTQWTFHSSARLLHLGLDYQSVFTSGLSTTDPSNPQLIRRAIFNRASLNAITADNRASYSFRTGEAAHTLLFGLDYQRLNYNEAQGLGNAPALSIARPDYGATITAPAMSTRARQVQDQLGLYLQDQVKLGRWTWLAGLRQDWASNDRSERISGSSVKQSDRAFTWRAGGVYQFDNGLAPYASYSRSFQPVADADAAGRLFKPTTGKQIEAGVKYQPASANLLATAALYQLTQNNVLTSDPNNTAYSIQTGQVRTRGLELEARAQVTRNVELIAAYTHTKNVNTRSTTAQGKHPTYVPDQSAGLWGTYTFHTGALAGLGVSAGVRHVGRSWADAANTTRVPSYTLLDAALRYDFGKSTPSLRGMTLALNLSNLTDKTFVSACATATKCFYGAGRTARATLSYRW